MIASISRSGVKPSAFARAVSKRAGQLPTMDSIFGSGCAFTSARAVAPPIRSSASSMSATVTEIPGNINILELPHALASRLSACIRLRITPRGESKYKGKDSGTGRSPVSPFNGSRIILLAKLEAAALGHPGRTAMVGSRRARPSTMPRREKSLTNCSPITFCTP